MPTTISNPASFSSVRNAFNTHGYGISTSLFAYRQGGGIVPSSSGFNAIGAGTVGDPLRLSQFSGFTVPDLLRFSPNYRYWVPSRASTGSGSRPVTAYFALRTNKTSDWGGSSAFPEPNPNGVDNTFGSYGPTSWASGDAVSSGYQVRLNVTTFSSGGNDFGDDLARWGISGNFHTITGTGFTPYYTISSDVVLEIQSSFELYVGGQVLIRSIAFPSVEISQNFFLEANGNA